MRRICRWNITTFTENFPPINDQRYDRLGADDSSSHRLVANAKCLSEGVDVPALDAVVFVDPRSSQVDMSAVGRAKEVRNESLWPHIVPILLDKASDIDSAVGRSEYKKSIKS